MDFILAYIFNLNATLFGNEIAIVTSSLIVTFLIFVTVAVVGYILNILKNQIKKINL